MIYAAVAIDLFSDGLMIGAGSVVSFTLALVLALGQVTADVPKGFAAIANFRDKGVGRAQWMLLSASFALPALAGATVSYWLLRGRAEVWQRGALAFTVGILIIAAVEELIGEAHEAVEDTHAPALYFIAGFALFALVGSYFQTCCSSGASAALLHGTDQLYSLRLHPQAGATSVSQLAHGCRLLS